MNLAPNGKKSNLNEVQYHLVRTPEFKAWFGDWENLPETASKVVDYNGEPLPVYHGTNSEPFVVFYDGSFFTDDYMNADGYASGEMIYEVFLNIKKPLIINARGRKWDNLKNKYGNSTRDIASELDTDKYDGVIFNNINDNWFDDEMGDTQNVYFTINSTQIKLADGTNTTFDSNNPDIRYSGGGETPYVSDDFQIGYDGAYEHLIAPNGKPSNLTPEQYALVRTPEFKAWFGDWENSAETASKVVDENGEPLVVYHSTTKNFTKFKDSKYSNYIFFSNDIDHVEVYGDIVYHCFLSIKNPSSNLYPKQDLKENNQDGFINNYEEKGFFNKKTRVYCVIKSNQIKLADGTNTTFDSNNADIRFMSGGNVLLAPNGKPSNLTPEQYKLVRTPAFKAWFGDWEKDPETASKVVDENGEPLICYHGSNKKFYVFDPSKEGLNKKTIRMGGNAIYFSNKERVARMFTDNYGEGYVYPCFLLFKNPIFLDAEGGEISYLNQELKKIPNTKDIIVKNTIDVLDMYKGQYQKDYISDIYITSNPNNIKLADKLFKPIWTESGMSKLKTIGKINTTFDSNNPDIRFELGGLYHGSPNNFCNNGFDTNKVGSSFSKGAMGWGIYFTSEKDIADRYSKIPSEEQGISYDEAIELMVIGKKVIGKRIISRDGDKDDSHKALSLIYPKDVNELRDKNSIFGDIKWFKNIDYPNVYKVTLHKGKSSLEYDYAESILTKRQILKIKIQAKKENLDLNIDNPDDYLYIFYNYLSEKLDGERGASLFLLRAGIDGIKYPCNYTDSIDEEKMDNCYNYVVFDSENITIDECIKNNPDIRYAEGGSVINRTYFDDGNKLVVFSAYRNYEPYKIAVNDINNADYITLWKTDTNTGKDKKVGALKLEDTSWLNNNYFLKVSYIEIDKSSRGLGLGLEMYKVALKYSADNIKGIKSYLPDRVNKRQIPKIYKALNGKVEDDDYAYIYKADNLGKFKDGGSISRTPAPKKDRIYGSSKNKPKSSESKSKASSIILSPTIIKSINTIIHEHNKDFQNKKITLSTAKAVVRRGMGAYSSSYRPTISGGKPNSRVAWGLARLKAFVYKIQKGHSKSGKYKQDNDLIDELGYKHDEYKKGGEMQKLDDLYKDHHKVWAISENIIKNVCKENCDKYSSEVYQLYELELKPHFVEEEKVFFPSVMNEQNEKLIKELIKEHHLVRFLVQKIRISKKTKDIKDFCNLMIEHIKKEESIMKTISADPYKDVLFDEGGKLPEFDITENTDGDRTTISLQGIGLVILVESYPKYEFLDDIGYEGLDELGLDEDDFIGKIEHIEVYDEYKGKGYGVALVNKAIEVAKSKGLFPLYLNASPMGNKGLDINGLTNFYEKFGFHTFLNQGGNNLMILKEEDVKFDVGGSVGYKYFLVLKFGKPIFKVKFSQYNKETERDMSDMLDKLHDMDYVLSPITEQEYKDFDYSKVDKEDIAEFTKNWTYLKQGGVVEKSNKIEFRKNRLPRKDIYEFAKMVKDKYPKVWDKGGNIFGNEAFVNLKRVLERGYWLPNEEWMQIKWQSYIARHHKDFRIEGVVAMLKWIGTVDKGWAYMKKLINEEIEKKYPKVDEKYKNGGQLGGKCPVGTQVQTLIFSKDDFSKEDAKDWAESHGYKYDYVDEKDNTYRIRQENPSKFVKDIFRTIEFKKGLKAVVACPKI